MLLIITRSYRPNFIKTDADICLLTVEIIKKIIVFNLTGDRPLPLVFW